MNRICLQDFINESSVNTLLLEAPMILITPFSQITIQQLEQISFILSIKEQKIIDNYNEFLSLQSYLKNGLWQIGII